MDDNPFANPFADDGDSDPFASVIRDHGSQSPTIAGYSSGFESSSRRASIVSANADPQSTGNAFGQSHLHLDTEESPYLRKLEQDGVISGISSPSAFQQPSFSTNDSQRHANEEIDAFHGGFYSPSAFNTVNPAISQPGFGLDESISVQGSQDGPAHDQNQGADAHVQQDNLEALGLAPAVDPTSSLKAAFIKHQPSTQSKSEAQETPVNGDKPVEESASATQSEPKARTGGLSAGARRKKKIVGISMDTVQQERERERQRLEKERVEKERLKKERQEREKIEQDQQEKENVDKKDAEDTKPDEASTPSPTERQPTISSTTAEQILLAPNPHHASQTYARQLDGRTESSDDFGTLPPLPDSGETTRASTPQPSKAEESASPVSKAPTREASTTSPIHAHPGVIRSHLDPVVTSPLDGTQATEEDDLQPIFQALALGASSTRPTAQSGQSSWGRAFDEDEPAQGSIGQDASSDSLPPSAGWTTSLPTSQNAQAGTWGSPKGQDTSGDAWGGGNGYAHVSMSAPVLSGVAYFFRMQVADSSIRPTATRPLSTTSIKSPALDATAAPPPPPKTEAPAFIIRIHDPTRVGDPIRGHVVYTVTTRTSSPHYALRESSVLRRFSQFLWLAERVGANNPGVIIPPVPDKQLSGRFEDQFVETRRAALEKCLNKMANHPVLSLDPDLRLFLESESFEFEVKHRKHESAQSQESKGLLATIGGSIGGPRFIEKDDWFEQKKAYLDSLESQMKGWIKSVESASKHRLDLSLTISDFSDTITALAESDLSMDLSQALQRLAGLTTREKEAQENQAKMDVVYLLNTADEYVRWIGSVRLAFASRIKSHFTWQQTEADAKRLKVQHEKLRKSGKIAHDRIQPALAEIAEAERKALDAHSDFDAVSRLVKLEFARYEHDRVEEFKHMFATYLDEMIIAQKEMVAAWETFLGILQRTTGDRPTQRAS
ncbi:hypothetical protein NliqN6_0111 [Naganishia liquefaciens]|uniref:PX domain-containing protein n=1 Tax=Naganishia liquefaciens TaxID=104408 RepID=A0A8H3YBW9_9TREE|nr:hypothetical protein NliqN6_0111 [Naganishia liquefaciens]